jgi:hypothetical protein
VTGGMVPPFRLLTAIAAASGGGAFDVAGVQLLRLVDGSAPMEWIWCACGVVLVLRIVLREVRTMLDWWNTRPLRGSPEGGPAPRNAARLPLRKRADRRT